MARDLGLEDLVRGDLPRAGLVDKRMFGGLCWLLDGNLVCGASSRGLLVRLGKDNPWALGLPGVGAAVMGGRAIQGWVRADESAYGEDETRKRLIDAAMKFARSLPPK